MKTITLPGNKESAIAAAALLSQGEVVALPTETVYGLAGNAFSKSSVAKIFQAKERPSFDPLIVHIPSKIFNHAAGPLQALVELEILSPEILEWPSRTLIEAAMKAFWPGPLTFILPRGPKIPDEVTSGQNTVGIRMPAHPLFQAVLNEINFPLAAPSANRFGRISPTTAAHVEQELSGRIAGILDGGACEVGVESTIIRVENPLQLTLLRPGKIGAEELQKHFCVSIERATALGEQNQAQLAPGMLDQHYAPKKPLYLFPDSFSETRKLDTFLELNTLGKRIAYLRIDSLSRTNNLDEIAQKLFSSMRTLDESTECDVIVAEVPPASSHPLRAAILDRLIRASTNKPKI